MNLDDIDTPYELLIEIFGENESKWPTIEDLKKSAMKNPVPFRGSIDQWIDSIDFEDGDLILCKWYAQHDPDGTEGNKGPFWLIYIYNQKIASFSYPNYGYGFWFKNAHRWWCSEVYGIIEYATLSKTKFMNWLDENPLEVKE